MLKVCLNGARTRQEHSAVPLSPAEAAAAAAAAVDAGAAAVHVHPRGPDGAESFSAEHIAATAQAVRQACPGVPVGVSTRDGVVGGIEEKLGLLAEWPGPEDGGPDMASVNWHEAGAEEVASLLVAQGIAVESGLWTPEAALRCVATGWVTRSVRVLVEMVPAVSGGVGQDAHELAAAVMGVLPNTTAPILAHGEEQWTWPVLRWAALAGLDVRIGLEDTVLDEAGERAVDNAALVAEAMRYR